MGILCFGGILFYALARQGQRLPVLTRRLNLDVSSILPYRNLPLYLRGTMEDTGTCREDVLYCIDLSLLWPPLLDLAFFECRRIASRRVDYTSLPRSLPPPFLSSLSCSFSA